MKHHVPIWCALAMTCALLAGCERVDRRCSMGQGWPCTCDNIGGQCKDGTTCVNLAADFPLSAPSAQAGSTGYCAPTCENPDVNFCPETDWGLSTLCWTETYTDEIYLCVIYCEKNGDCPQGQVCTDGQYCHPGQE